ncbi:mitochondrial carrier [Lizonia empirigonia]|nr:mitochondrial carrier [Lizonia empirigonia]
MHHHQSLPYPGVELEIPTVKPTLHRTPSSQPSVHFLAGASGGIVTALLTSPLDVLRTRLQSDFYRDTQTPRQSQSQTSLTPARLLRPLQHLRETSQIITSIYNLEGWRGFFRGLAPSIVGVVPATAIKFYAYGSCKSFGTTALGYKEDSALLHAQAAIAAGLVTATATNPIWLVKTRLQLDNPQASSAVRARQYQSTVDCVRKVVRQEGIKGLYRGLSASYLGTAETALHLVLYEQLKVVYRKSLKHNSSLNDELSHWISTSGASGSAKFATVLLTYPHEVVIRTRLRQAPTDSGCPRYTGLWQCFRSVGRQEGLTGLYGGLTPHMARSIPSAVITLGVYEFVLRLLGT